jgi:uncharacterized LabA/DUF88 family protein
LQPTEKAKRLDDPAFPSTNGDLGVYLFLLASTQDPTDTEGLERLLRGIEAPPPAAEAAAPPPPDAAARDEARLRKRIAEFQRKIQYLEGQLAKSRETEKAFKRDLVQRKGELAEARMLAERLRREFQDARSAAAEGPAARASSPATDAVLGELTSALRKLVAEQRKLAHRIEKLSETPPTIQPEMLAPVLDSLAEVQKETTALRRERKKDQQAHAERLDEMVAAVRGAARAAAEAAPSRTKAAPARRKGEPERVGVFIDVQNVYYGARQLKGKLDFDALLEAAVLDRRLIQATAYMVESKEIDQWGFIAMLEQRAIDVRRKTLRVRSDGSMKGDWDMEMALDILDAAPRLDVIVLVSGDGDFTSLVNRVKGMGPRVEVIAFPRNTAKSLLEAADRFQPLDRRYMIRPAPSPTAAPAPEDPPRDRPLEPVTAATPKS